MPRRWATSITRGGPTLENSRTYAQLTDPTVAARTSMTPPLLGSALTVVYFPYLGLSTVQGEVPSTRSLGEYPASSAAARVITFHAEPTWRPGAWVTMLYSSSSKPGPPTSARTAPVRGSTATSAAVNGGVSGRTEFTAV